MSLLTETGVMSPQAQEHLGPPELEKAGRLLLWSLQREVALLMP